MSINDEPQIEQTIGSGSVPTTIKPFDGTDPAYTVEEYLNSIVAAMIFSSGKEPVKKTGHHQWKVKRATLTLHTLQGPAQKWYSLFQVIPNWIGKYFVKNSETCLTQKNQNNKQK